MAVTKRKSYTVPEEEQKNPYQTALQNAVRYGNTPATPQNAIRYGNTPAQASPLTPYQTALGAVSVKGTTQGAVPAATQTQGAVSNPNFSPVNYDTVIRRAVDNGFRMATDQDKALWGQISAASAAGDTATVNALLDQIRADGNFFGYYDEAGNYTGFARGFNNDASGSYQPVLGGKLMTNGMSTDQWLTPDGKVMGSSTGSMADTGNTWGYWQPGTNGTPGSTEGGIGMARKRAEAIAAGNTSAFPQGKPLDGGPAIQADGYIVDKGISQTGGGQGGQISQSQTPTGQTPAGQSYGGAPAAYDPTTNPMYINFINKYGNMDSPEWQGGDFDWRNTPEYQQFIEKYGNAEAPQWEGSKYDAMRDEAIQNAGKPWERSEYQKARDDALKRAEEMQWEYDMESDPVWQAYVKQYTREGQRAMQDTLGQTAARTGGIASSYAVSAANQARNYYAQQLSDKIPQLYSDAYNRYLQEFQRQMGISDQYAGFDDREYARWADQQNQNLALADRYNQYGQQDYGVFQDRLGQWNTDRNWHQGVAQDAVGNDRADYNTRYSQYLDQLDQYNNDRNFWHGAAREDQQVGRQANQDQYGRYIDDRNWQQNLREYADAQGWKAAEWLQYLREYDDQLSQADKEWAYKMYQDAQEAERYADETNYQRAIDRWEMGNTDRANAWKYAQAMAQYGDYTGLQGLNVNTSELTNAQYAYAPDGTTYDIGSYKGQNFLASAAPGQTMRGGDGSIWTKNADGTVTIQHKGQTFTYGSPMESTGYTGYSGGGSGRGSGSGSGSGTALERMKEMGIGSEVEALDWLLSQGYGITAAQKLAAGYAATLGGPENAGTDYDADTINWARSIMTNAASGKVDRNSREYAEAAKILGWEMQGDTGGYAPESTLYGDLTADIDGMVKRGASWKEIQAELEGALRDGDITDVEYKRLRDQYIQMSDNAPNREGMSHSDGRPQSTGYTTAYQAVETRFASRGDRNGALNYLLQALDAGKIHEYEVDMIMDRFGL